MIGRVSQRLDCRLLVGHILIHLPHALRMYDDQEKVPAKTLSEKIRRKGLSLGISGGKSAAYTLVRRF
jgi:hypothetical protein